MSVKKFIAPTMQQAMKSVSEQLGPDALILSTKRTEKGVEVLAKTEQDLSTVSKNGTKNLAVAKASPVARSTKPMKSDRTTPSLTSGFKQKQQNLEKQNLVDMLQSAKEGKKDELARELTTWQKKIDQREQSKSTLSRQFQNEFVPPETATEEIQHLRQEVSNLRRWFEEDQSEMPAAARPPSAFYQDLQSLGFGTKVCDAYAQKYQHMEVEDAWILTRTRLSEQLGRQALDVVSSGGVFSFVGPTGAGKTTTLSKLATLYTLRYGAEQLAIISTDHQRIGAHDTLQTLSKILGCDLFRLSDSVDPKVQQRLQSKTLILIDTNGSPGEHQSVLQSLSHYSWFGMLKSLLVLPANISEYGIKQAHKRYAAWKPQTAVLTKVDECPVAGGVLSSLIEQQMSLSYWTNGASIPEDIVKGDLGRLLEQMQKLNEEELLEAV